LAKHERPVNASDKGGGVELTEEPERVIEEYLSLVNDHLPESISDDVITELRTYMIETAFDLGNGELTLQAAKKVVAQFGAPSEVAEEYKYSMLPETIPRLNEEASRDKPTQEQLKEPPSTTEEHELRANPTVSYFNFFLQGLSIVAVWSLLINLASTLLGPIWLLPGTVITLACQIILVLIVIGLLSYSLKRRKVVLWKRSYPEWPLLQRFFTLPENVIREPSNILVAVDILGSLIGVGLFVLSTLYVPSPYYIPLIGIPTSVALMAKAFYSGSRMSSLNPADYIKRELLTTIIALFLIDSSQIWFAHYAIGSFSFLPFIWIYSVVWGSVLFFQLVIRGGDFWLEAAEFQPTASKQFTDKLLQKTANAAGATTLKIIGWIMLFTIIPTYCLMISKNIYTPWFAPVWIAIFFGPIFLSPVVLYFLFRRWSISNRRTNDIIGKRSRFEAVGDLVISIVLFSGFILMNGIWLNQSYLVEQYHLVFLDFGSFGILYYLIGYISSYMLLIISLGLRIVGNCLEFSSKRMTATEIIMISGRTLIIALSFRVGIDILSYSTRLFPLSLYPALLFLVVLIAFQIETSQIRLTQKKLDISDVSIKSSRFVNPSAKISRNIQIENESDRIPRN